MTGMQTTIVNPIPVYKQRKQDQEKINDLEDRIDNLLTEISELASTISELEDELEKFKNDYQVETPLGNITLLVDTGNTKIQEELDAFAKALKEKYS